MLERNRDIFQEKHSMGEKHARILCRKLERGGITLPDNCIAFQGKK